VFDLFNSWLTAAHIGYEAQSVMVMRMMRLAAGGPVAAAEARRMMAEKMAAAADAQIAFGLAIANGSAMHHAAAKAFLPFRRRVSANHRRLAGARR
jgi:hypothetical protein